MKTMFRLIICLLTLCGAGSMSVLPTVAQEAAAEPLISLSVKDEPLAEALETITRDTGYQFNISRNWENYPVSATIRHLPLEQGLKRLLRSLNHTIVWESDKVVTIMVYGKTEPGRSGSAISYPAPPPPYPDEEMIELPTEPEFEPAHEPTPEDPVEPVPDTDAVEPDEGLRESGDNEQDPEQGKPPGSRLSTTDAKPGGVQVED